MLKHTHQNLIAGSQASSGRYNCALCTVAYTLCANITILIFKKRGTKNPRSDSTKDVLSMFHSLVVLRGANNKSTIQ